jgi:ABC-type Zn2+ transport system substrate-binding protein/surface adhesin
VLAFQADVFETRSAYEDFPGWSGFKRSIEDTLLPLAAKWGKPVLVIHGDSHQFRVDQPFALRKAPLRNVTRLIVPGASDVRAVRVEVRASGQFAFELIDSQ